MRPFNFLFLFCFFGYFLCQVSGTTTVRPTKAHNLRELLHLKPISPPKQQSYKLTTVASPRKAPQKPIYQKETNPRKPPQRGIYTQQRTNHRKAPNFVEQGRQIQRRDVPFQQTFLGVPVQIENVKQTPAHIPTRNLYPQLPKAPVVKPLIKPNETEAERAERIHKSFDRLMTFVEIVGQVDNYVSSKWKNLVKTVSNFYETEDQPSYRVSSKRIYGSCPHAQ